MNKCRSVPLIIIDSLTNPPADFRFLTRIIIITVISIKQQTSSAPVIMTSTELDIFRSRSCPERGKREILYHFFIEINNDYKTDCEQLHKIDNKLS